MHKEQRYLSEIHLELLYASEPSASMSQIRRAMAVGKIVLCASGNSFSILAT